MISPVILTDLDDTIFTTMKNYAGIDPETLQRAATATNGNHSYMCAQRQAIYTWLAMGATVIPVTARSAGAYERVHAGPFTDGAVLSNGAIVLLPDGTEDLVWKDKTAVLCARAEKALNMGADMVSGMPQYRVLRHYRGEDLIGITIKANVDLHSDDGMVDELITTAKSLVSSVVDPARVVITSNGNNLSLIPAGVSKLEAVKHILTRDDLKGRPLIGAGDSTSDLPFMSICDMMIIPTQSQITQNMEGFGK